MSEDGIKALIKLGILISAILIGLIWINADGEVTEEEKAAFILIINAVAEGLSESD